MYKNYNTEFLKMDKFSSSGDGVGTPKLDPLDQGVISLRDQTTRCHSTIFTGDMKG